MEEEFEDGDHLYIVKRRRQRRSNKNRSRRRKITTRYKYSTPLLYKVLDEMEAQK